MIYSYPSQDISAIFHMELAMLIKLDYDLHTVCLAVCFCMTYYYSMYVVGLCLLAIEPAIVKDSNLHSKLYPFEGTCAVFAE